MDIGVKNQIRMCVSKMRDNDFASLENSLSQLGFNRLQVVEIEKGIKNGIDAAIYADNMYDAAQMKSIRLALEEGMDVSPFMSPAYGYMQIA